MKIALVCDWYHPRVGGIERHLQDLARLLTLAGHDVHVITPTPGDAVVAGIPVHRIDAPRVPRFGFVWTPAALGAIGAVMVRERFDVAHCHVSIVSPAAFGGADRAQRLGIPAVMTFHSVVPQTRLLATAIDLVVRSSRWPVVFSAVSRRVAREVEPLARDRMVKYLPNGVDRSFWAPTTPRPRMSERLEVISVMRLNRKKRPLALVGLMRRLVRLLPPRASARLRIAGDGPERRHLEHAIARRGLSDHVELLGRRTRGELRDLFGSGHVFVLPTVRESFGIAALEARCSGLPVVAMAGSGVSELIAHDREGLLAKSDAELASHVASLARDPARWSAIAEHNRATPPPCDWSAVLPAHLEIYSEAIALRASRVRSA